MVEIFEKLMLLSPEKLKNMSREELLRAQESVLTPQELKDMYQGRLHFSPGDPRDEFFEFTDRLLV